MPRFIYQGGTSLAVTTTEAECIEALRDAADRLGESPTKAAYEELELQPAASTILRVMGSWNEAKEAAELETYASTGSRVGPKPENVDLPDGVEWEQLSVDQRWHYRNVEWNEERTLKRRARIRAWVNEVKCTRGCSRCDETDPTCLDFHHPDPENKRMAITRMVTFGYGKESLREEMDKCEVLCANCHRKEHYEEFCSDYGGGSRAVDDGGLRTWLHQYKRASDGCTQCPETNPVCLDFHHDGDEKRETVANMISDRRPKDVIREEIERCTVLCANCHRKEHYKPPKLDESDKV